MAYWPDPSLSLEDQETRNRLSCLNLINREDVALPFRQDYRDYLCRALEHANNLSVSNAFVAEIGKPSSKCLACTIETKTISVHIIRPAFVGYGQGFYDIAILHEPQGPSYILLQGEHRKMNLSYGVRGFCLPFVDPIKEATNIIEAWQAFSATITAEQVRKGNDDLWDKTTAFGSHMIPLGLSLREIISKYIDRTFGKGVIKPTSILTYAKSACSSTSIEAPLQNLFCCLKNRQAFLLKNDKA